MFPEAALPLWASFYRHELISNNGTEHDPRYITTRHRFGELAVNTGLGEFQPISAIAKADTLPPGLKLLLSFYRLDQSRNSFGPQHPVPRELFNLAKQHHLADELEAFRRQIPSDGRNDLNFLARYTQFLIAAADAEDPRIINGARFWQETQTEAKLITGKASRT